MGFSIYCQSISFSGLLVHSLTCNGAFCRGQAGRPILEREEKEDTENSLIKSEFNMLLALCYSDAIGEHSIL